MSIGTSGDFVVLEFLVVTEVGELVLLFVQEPDYSE
jgi:hypothetical protein